MAHHRPAVRAAVALLVCLLLAGCAEAPGTWSISIRNVGDAPLDVEVQAEGDGTVDGFRGRLEPGDEWNRTFSPLPPGVHRFSGTVAPVNGTARAFDYDFVPSQCQPPEAYHHVRVEDAGGRVDLVTLSSCA